MTGGRARAALPPLLGAAAGAGAALLGQSAPPFHLPTHEFTQSFSPVAGVGVFLWGWRRSRRRDASAAESLGWTLLLGAATGAGAIAAMAIVNAAVHHCRMAEAVASFWVTWLPLAIFAAVAGVVAGDRGASGRRVAATLVLLVLAGAAHDGLQAWRGVRVMDPWLGSPGALDQRADLRLDAIDVLQRTWLLAGAWAVWVAHRSRSRTRAALAIAAVSVAALAAGSHVGLGWGTARLRAELRATKATAHFLLRYDPRGEASLHLDAIAREAEWQWHRLTPDLGAPSRPIELRVFDGVDALREATGLGSAHAMPGHVNLPWRQAFSETLAHEMVHVLALDRSWWRPSAWLRRGVTEGLAVAWSEDLARLPEAHREQAAALRAGHLPSPRRFMGPVGFWTVNERSAYAAAGSFLGWLALEHGAAKAVELGRGRDVERVYGASLDALDAGWRRFLSGIEVDPESRVLARRRFDPAESPAYVDATCPKLGACEDSPADAARRRYEARDYAGALALWREQAGREKGVRAALRIAACLQQLGRPEEALAALSDAAPATVEDRDELLSSRIASLAALRDWGRLDAATEERTRNAGGTSFEREMAGRCLADIGVRDAVASALDPGNASRRQALLADLARGRPDLPCLRFLALARPPAPPPGSFSLGAAAREAAREQLRFLEEDPRACESLDEPLGRFVDAAIRSGELDLAESVAASVERLCDDPLARHRAAQRRSRVAWERTRGAP